MARAVTAARRWSRLGLRSSLRRGAWAVLFGLLTAIVFASAGSLGGVNVRAGQVAPVTLKAPRTFVDRPTTDRLRLAAEQRVAPVYTPANGTLQQVLGTFD